MIPLMQLCLWHVHLVLQLRRPNLLKHRAPSFGSSRSQTQLPKPVGTRMEHRSTHKTTANQKLPNRLCSSLQMAYSVRRSLAVREKQKCSLMWTKKVFFHLCHICWGIFQKQYPMTVKLWAHCLFSWLCLYSISVSLWWRQCCSIWWVSRKHYGHKRWKFWLESSILTQYILATNQSGVLNC